MRRFGWTACCFGLLLSAGVPVASAQQIPKDNLVLNAGFEACSGDTLDPAGPWQYFSSGRQQAVFVVSTNARSGERCVRLVPQAKPHADSGLFQRVAVTPGEIYEASVWARNDRTSPLSGSAGGSITLEWRNAADQETGRVVSPRWDRMLSRLRWSWFSIRGEVPPGAVAVHIAIHVCDGPQGGGGTCLVDDVRLIQEGLTKSVGRTSAQQPSARNLPVGRLP